MNRHRFDALSFLFGGFFLVVAILVLAAGSGVDYVMTLVNLGRWFVAGLAAVVGLAILGRTISSMTARDREEE